MAFNNIVVNNQQVIGVDETPAFESENLITSGGVYESLMDMPDFKEYDLISNNIEGDGYYRVNGTLDTNPFWKHTSILPIESAYNCLINLPTSVYNIVLYDEEQQPLMYTNYPISGYKVLETIISKSFPDAKYVRFQLQTNLLNSGVVYCITKGKAVMDANYSNVKSSADNIAMNLVSPILGVQHIIDNHGNNALNANYQYICKYDDKQRTIYGVRIYSVGSTLITLYYCNKQTKTKEVISARSINGGYNYIFFDNPYVIDENHQIGLQTTEKVIPYMTYNVFISTNKISGFYLSDAWSYYDWQATIEMITAVDNKFVMSCYDMSIKALNASKQVINKCDVDDAVCSLILGSSLTACTYQSKSMAWPEKVNDMVDVNLINYGQSGATLNMNLIQIARNELKFNFRPSELHLDYLLIANTSNNSLYNAAGVRVLENAEEIAASYGAKLLVTTEEDIHNLVDEFDRTYGGFSHEHNVPFCPVGRTWRKCFPKGPNGEHYAGPYLDWLGFGHSGVRMQTPYLMLNELISRIPIKKSVKLFKVRPTYKTGSPTVSDLVYDSNTQRLRYFTAVSCGADDSYVTSRIDNMTDSQYVVGEGDNTGISSSETAAMIKKANVSFNKYGLIEFIIDKVDIDSCLVTFTCSVNPTKVYIAKTKNTKETYNDEPRTEWSEVQYTINSDNDVEFEVTSQNNDIELFDKVRVLVYYDGAFSMANPSITYYGGKDKIISDNSYRERRIGKELNDKTSCESGWSFTTGASVKSFPAQIANYTGYNQVKSHIELVSGTATKTITLEEKVRKVAIRVVC